MPISTVEEQTPASKGGKKQEVTNDLWMPGLALAIASVRVFGWQAGWSESGFVYDRDRQIFGLLFSAAYMTLVSRCCSRRLRSAERTRPQLRAPRRHARLGALEDSRHE